MNAGRPGGRSVAVAKSAKKLAKLLRSRSTLENMSAFTSNTHYSICGVIDAAGVENLLYRQYLKPEIQGLRGQFDLKYWPSPDKCIDVIAREAENASVAPTDPITEAATATGRATEASFFRALLKGIEEGKLSNGGHLPEDFTLIDQNWATIANCALGLEVTEWVDAPYVKRFRQGERARN